MEKKSPKLELIEPGIVKPADAGDIEALLLDPALGDGITNVNYHSVPVGKPKSFFRTVKDASYRRQTWIYTHKTEDKIEEVNYIVAEPMRDYIDGARPCTLVTVVYRNGSPRIWPIKQPKEGEKDNAAWTSARAAVKLGLEHWVRLVWCGSSYITREAPDGYAPDPDFSKLPSFSELLALAFSDALIIRDKNHAIYCDLFGTKPKKGEE